MRACVCVRICMHLRRARLSARGLVVPCKPASRSAVLGRRQAQEAVLSVRAGEGRPEAARRVSREATACALREPFHVEKFPACDGHATQ